MKPAIVGLLACLALSLAACGTTTLSGHVGDTLSAGGVKVTVERVDLHPRVPADDLSGLSSPAPGDRLVGIRVLVCTSVGPAIGSDNFAIGLAGGGSGRLKFPSQNYPDAFQFLSDGCSHGWVVFEFPRAGKPTEIRFAFDDTGSGSGNNVSGRPETHERFSWAL